MFYCRSFDEWMSFMMDNDNNRHKIWYVHINIYMRINMLHI